jgi:dimethylhistidine N-methyltransferase
LLNALEQPAAYVPIDISRAQLIEFSIELGRTFPSLLIQPVCADYTEEFTLPPIDARVDRTVVFFPGSTIGNFEPVEAARFLRRMRRHAGENGGMLIGVDLRKDPAILERAYDDPEGVTSEFNRNLLARMNRECGADFNLDAFHHRAVYDEQHGRVEMQLVSTRWQLVTFPATEAHDTVHIEFAPGEFIVTEHCYKYTIDGFQELAATAGFRPARVWTDDHSSFSLHWLESDSTAD